MNRNSEPAAALRRAGSSPGPQLSAVPSAVPVPADATALLALEELEAVSRALEEHTLAPNSKRAYAQAWRSFEGFCAAHGLTVLPAHPETVRWYVAWMSSQQDQHGLPRYAVSTIRQYLAGVAHEHTSQGHLDPTGHPGVLHLLRGLAKLRAQPQLRMKPLLLDDVVRVVQAMEHDVYPSGLSAARDALAIWLGFAGALRRSEAAGIQMDQVLLHPEDGAHVRLGKTKTDQENHGVDVVVLPFGEEPVRCPVCALHRWVALVRLSEQPDVNARQLRQDFMRQLFSTQWNDHVCHRGQRVGWVTNADFATATPLLRATFRNRHAGRIHATGVSGDALHAMLLVRLRQAGIDARGYGFHSLRAGHVTQALRQGAPTEEIMRGGRWKRIDTVRIYDRETNPAARNSVTRLGL